MPTRAQAAFESKLAEVKALPIAAMNEHVPAGLALGIVHRRRVLYAKGFGLASPATIRHLLTHTAGIGELRTLTDVFRPFYGLGTKRGTPIPAFGAYYGVTLCFRGKHRVTPCRNTGGR